MKKTIYLSLALLALISLASSCNQNNEKKVYVKASLPNGWTANPACGNAAAGACGQVGFSFTGSAGVISHNNILKKENNDLFLQSQEYIMDLNQSNNLAINIGGSSSFTNYTTFETTYYPNTVLVEVFVNGSVYDSRTVTLDGTGAQQIFNVIIE